MLYQEVRLLHRRRMSNKAAQGRMGGGPVGWAVTSEGGKISRGSLAAR